LSNAAESSSNAVPDERVVQRRALLQRLGLSTSHYLKLQEPQGPGQAAQVDLEPLLNTAAICLMPDQLTYHWWQAPAAAKQLTPDDNPLATGTRPATQPNAVDIHAGSQAVPGLIEVKASAGIAHAERRVDCLPAKRGLPSPVAFSETAASVSAGTTPAAGSSAASAPQPSTSPAADVSVSNSNDGSPFGCSPVHVQIQVLKSLRRLLTAKLDAIAGGSAEEDRMLAKQPGCSQAAVMALEYRAGQKEIASAALTSLVQKSSDTVCLAAARLPAQSSWVSSEGQFSTAEQVNKGLSRVTKCIC